MAERLPSEPAIVEPLVAEFRGHEVATLPPPFGGWVMLQILQLLEELPPQTLDADDAERRVQLLRAMRIAHRSRRDTPVPDFRGYAEDVAVKISEVEARRLLADEAKQVGLLSHVVPDGELDAKVGELTKKLAGQSPTAMRILLPKASSKISTRIVRSEERAAARSSCPVRRWVNSAVSNDVSKYAARSAACSDASPSGVATSSESQSARRFSGMARVGMRVARQS